MAALAESATQAVRLTTGTIHIGVERTSWPLEALCDFAARENPRRGFLVVSKVLGRHVPAKPSTMRASVRDLAALIPADLPGPLLVMGLAETAICLGQSVHEELARFRDDLVFLHSTRMEIGAPVLCRFAEPHSHAAAHLVYRPLQAAFLGAARSLVIVDDEVSTGTTLLNLAHAMAPHLPALERIVAATLTDWSGQGDWLKRMPTPAQAISLLRGSLDWQPDARVGVAPTIAFDAAAAALGTLDQRHNFGRLGVPDGAVAMPHIDLPPASRIRVLGTGEFTYPAFRFAEALEVQGHDVVMQSTTRSPARIDGAIRSMHRFADNYGTEVANYLYNADPLDGRITLIAHETPPGSVDPVLVAALDAQTLDFAGLA